MTILKPIELPIKEFAKEMIDNCFFVEDWGTSKISRVPLNSLFDFIKKEAEENGLVVELKEDFMFIKKA